MRRRALIIGNPGENGAENYCAGVSKDLANYKAFLTSPLGGAWYANEIAVLERPTCSDARFAIQSLRDADYSFSVFSGHGYTDNRSGTLRLELKAGHLLTEDEYRQGAPKHSVVFDCCRVVATSTLTEERMLKAVIARADADFQESRKYYEQSIAECAKGVVAMFACSKDESASDDSRAGGYYSTSLILETKNWSDNRTVDTRSKYALLTVVRAHEAAETAVQRRSAHRQNPSIEKPRSSPYFPFAIIA